MGDQLATRVVKYSDDPSKSKAVIPNVRGVSGIDRSLGDKLRSLAINVGFKTALPLKFVKTSTVDIQFKLPQKNFVPLPLLTPQEAEFLRANYQHLLLWKVKFVVTSLVPPGTVGKLGIGLYDTRMMTENSACLGSFQFAASKREFSFTVEPHYYVSTLEDLSSLWSVIPQIIDVPIELSSYPFHIRAHPAFVATNELSGLPQLENCTTILTGPDVDVGNRIAGPYDMKTHNFDYRSRFSAAKELSGSTSLRFNHDERPTGEDPPADVIQLPGLEPKFEAAPQRRQSYPLQLANSRH